MAPDEAIFLVQVTDDVATAKRLRTEWEEWPHGKAQLAVIESPLRLLTGPLMRFIDEVGAAHPGEIMLVVLPGYVPGH